jgi:hypothetical protein
MIFVDVSINICTDETLLFYCFGHISATNSSCPFPQNVTDARSDFNTSQLIQPVKGTVVHYKCHWSSQVTCQDNGTWDNDPASFICPSYSSLSERAFTIIVKGLKRQRKNK